MTYAELITRISPEATSQLSAAINNRILNEKQLLRIFNVYLKRSTKISNLNSDYKIAIAASQLGLVLHALSNSDIKRFDPIGYKNTISRLQSNSVQDTINEIICHLILSKLFIKYTILSLFGNSADGLLHTNFGNIAVEIKSRFPEVFYHLVSFFDQASACIPMHDLMDCELTFTINKVNNFTIHELLKELDEFREACSSLKLDELPPFPGNITYKSRSASLDYTAELIVRPVLSNRISLSAPHVKEEDFMIHFSCRSVASEGMCIGLGNYKFMRVKLEDEVKNYLSSILIDDCIRRAGNIPKNGGIFVIYTEHHTGVTEKFISGCIKKYLKSHPRLAIIIAHASFDPLQANGESKIWAGEQIAPVLEGVFSEYQLIETVVAKQ